MAEISLPDLYVFSTDCLAGWLAAFPFSRRHARFLTYVVGFFEISLVFVLYFVFLIFPLFMLVSFCIFFGFSLGWLLSLPHSRKRSVFGLGDLHGFELMQNGLSVVGENSKIGRAGELLLTFRTVLQNY